MPPAHRNVDGITGLLNYFDRTQRMRRTRRHHFRVLICPPLSGGVFSAVAGVYTHEAKCLDIISRWKEDPALPATQERIPRRRVVRIHMHHGAGTRAADNEEGVFREDFCAHLRRHRVTVGVEERGRCKVLEQVCSSVAEVVVESIPV